MSLSVIERSVPIEGARPTIKHRLIVAFGLSFWSLCEILPVTWASALGGFTMNMFGRYARRMRKVQTNLDIAFPSLSSAERNRILRGMRRNFGRTWAEMPHLREICRPGSPWIEVQGSQNYEREIAAGRPVVFVSAHLGNWEIVAGYVAHRGTPLTVVYSPNRNSHIRDRLYRYRQGLQCGLAPKQSAARSLFKALSLGKSVGLLVDTRSSEGPLIPLFGRAAQTTTLPARLARRFGASVVPTRCQRLGGTRFRITFDEPLRPEDVPSGTEPEIAVTTTINTHIENWIRIQPADWYCVGRRWPRATAPSRNSQPTS
jgi:KDO2-lipid IV(A) lauroyltransferase